MANIPDIPQGMTTTDMQAWVDELKHANGWKQSFDDVEKEFLLFTEEVGELAKEIRRKKGGNIAEDSDQSHKLADEFADVFVYFCELANLCEVNIEDALRQKMEKNKKRTWHKVKAS